MKVKLVSYSTPSEELMEECVNTSNELIAYCARVSNPGNQSNKATADKLLDYLAKENHWSPFEMVSVCVEVETTRDIARQFLRHRSFSFQEFSQRYADPTKDLAFEVRDCRMQDTKNRQNSIPTDDFELAAEWLMRQTEVINSAENAYKWAVKNGIAKEQARAVLPEGNTVSRMYVNGTVRSWMHYIALRSGNGTQLEHIEVAKACADIIAPKFPFIMDYVCN